MRSSKRCVAAMGWQASIRICVRGYNGFMRLPSECIEDERAKRHGENLAGVRLRSAEREAERAIARNPMLVVSAVAALVTMIFVPPSLAYVDYIHWHTLICLLCILMVISAFDSSGLLEFVAHSMAERVKSLRALVVVLVLVTLGCSMILSNDMTLVTILPLAVLLLRSIGRERDIPFVFIMITLTANLGGMLLPFGNPHNLYLYTSFGVDFGQFVATMAPPLVLSMVLILACCLFVGKAEFHYRKPPTIILSKPHVAVYAALFALCIAMTLGAVSYVVGALVVIIVMALADRTVFAKTDYALVLTFVCFFVFSGNIAQIPEVSAFFEQLIQSCGAFLASLFSSQVISNVPTAILLSHFSDDWAGIALGTNVGAVGTPISSLATLIALRQYQKVLSEDAGRQSGDSEGSSANDGGEAAAGGSAVVNDGMSGEAVPKSGIAAATVATDTGNAVIGAAPASKGRGANGKEPSHGLVSNKRFLLRFEAYNFAFLAVVALFEFFVMGVR